MYKTIGFLQDKRNAVLGGDAYDRMNQSDDLWLVLDTHHEFQYANDVWYRWHDLKKGKYSVDGQQYSQIPHDAYAKCTDQFENHDLQVIESRMSIPSVEIHEYDCFNGWMAIFSETIPVIYQGEVINLVIHARQLSRYFESKHGRFMEPIFRKREHCSMYLHNPGQLHNAAFDTVFLYMLGFKSKEISRYRQVSESTVRNTLVNARIKFGLQKNSDLRELAIDKGWYEHIPSMFRSHDVSLVNQKLNGKLKGEQWAL